jgi:uroporphyrin-III C-methyltransferase
VTFVTAHAQDHSEPDWAALAATGTTLVIYMGMSRLSSIQAGLRAAGLPAEMPAAVIERAASPDERVLVTSLGLLAREAQLGGYASPAVIVVGEVVALATVREAELRRCWARCA